MKADLTCAYGGPDCNRCVNDVRGEFAKLGNLTKPALQKYEYGVSSTYQPANWTPRDFLTRQAIAGHLQSFVRLPVDTGSDQDAWFAATYSDSKEISGVRTGAVYLVRAPVTWAGHSVRATGHMEYVYKTAEHPGGAQAIGRYLAVGVDDFGSATLDVYNLSSKSDAHKETAKLPHRTAGVGLAKLAAGGYLIMSKRWGSNTTFDLYHTLSLDNLARYTDLRLLGSGNGATGAENVSVVTECGTGDLYGVTTTGDEPLHNDNYWSLYAITGVANAPRIDLVSTKTTEQSGACDGRASATAFATMDGDLSFYCSQNVGTQIRTEAGTCAELAVGPSCSGFWDCAVAVSTGGLSEVVENGYACIDAATLDDEMQFKEWRQWR